MVSIAVVVVQSLSYVQLFVTPWTAACQALLSFTISQSLLKLMATESMVPSNHPVLGHPLLLLRGVARVKETKTPTLDIAGMDNRSKKNSGSFSR